MFKNLSGLRSELLNRLKTNSSLVGTSRLTDWLNDAQDDVSTEIDLENLIEEDTILTVANQRKYLSSFEFNKIMSVVDVTQNLDLSHKLPGQFDSYDPSRDDTGAPFSYSTHGLDWSDAQPDTAATISIVSSSTSDTTQKVRINGLVSGVRDTELLTLTGTTTATGIKLFSEIASIAKDESTTGRVTVTSNDAGTTQLALMAPAEKAVQRTPFFFYPIPSDVRTIRLKGYRRPHRMIYDQDFPDMPKAFHELVLYGALIRGHMDLFRRNMAEVVRTREFNPLLEKLKKQMGNWRSKRSPVIGGRQVVFKGGRLPPEFGV